MACLVRISPVRDVFIVNWSFRIPALSLEGAKNCHTGLKIHIS